MTTEDIIRMAREAGLPTVQDTGEILGLNSAIRFAALVAAAEREAIAQMIEDSPPLVSFAQNEMGGCVMCGFTPKLAALTIRERGAP
jgi:hypothetical protein